MIKRYQDDRVAKIWHDRKRLELWQKTELMYLQAKVNLGILPRDIFEKINNILTKTPISLKWWLARDKEIHHDLNAFIDERIRHLPKKLQEYVHKKITSYDTEESAFVRMLKESLNIVFEEYKTMDDILKAMSLKYRYILMCSRTHGQQAELQSQGKKSLTWRQDLRSSMKNLRKAMENLKYSKLSGASGNYGSIDPKVEEETLRLLGFEPYYGSTQILPRLLFAPIAQGLAQLVETLNKIALDIRLGSRSGLKIYDEPFKKKQKGSSAMPHKKNNIRTEQIQGMARMARGFMAMIMENISTWEERAIEQSCVERVAWPDLFHITMQSLIVMNRVLSGLVIYPENMLIEIYNTRGCYASSEAKEVLKKLGVKHELSADECYRIVQLAAFNVFEPSREIKDIQAVPPRSLNEAEKLFHQFPEIIESNSFLKETIQILIPHGKLRYTEQLDINEKKIQRWNNILCTIFSNMENLKQWNIIFLPSFLLRNEDTLFKNMLKDE